MTIRSRHGNRQRDTLGIDDDVACCLACPGRSGSGRFPAPGSWARSHRRCSRAPNRFGHVRAGGAAWPNATSPTQLPRANHVTVANMSCHCRSLALEANPPKEHPCAAHTRCRSTLLGRQRTDAVGRMLKYWNRLKSSPQLVTDFSSCHPRHDTSHRQPCPVVLAALNLLRTAAAAVPVWRRSRSR